MKGKDLCFDSCYAPKSYTQEEIAAMSREELEEAFETALSLAESAYNRMVSRGKALVSIMNAAESAKASVNVFAEYSELVMENLRKSGRL